MGYVIEIPNVFDMNQNKALEVRECTVFEFLCEKEGGTWTQFDIPTVVRFNGREVMQAEYHGLVIRKDDVVTITPLVGDVTTIVFQIVLSLALTAVSYLFAPKPPKVGDEGDTDPTYSLSGQTNENPLGKAVPSGFGYTKDFPNYLAAPYNRTIGNDQYQLSLYDLGWGSFDVTEHQLEDTPIGNYNEVIAEVYLPGVPITLFRDAVITSGEVNNIALLPIGHPDNIPGTPVGPFIINAVGTQIDRIEADIIFPQGLFALSGDGDVQGQDGFYRIEYQEIDDSDVPVGSWIDLIDANPFLASRNAQRFTHGVDVTLGRYWVRGRNPDTYSDSTTNITDVNWEAVRGFFPNVIDYGDRTIVAVQALATNNLNNQTKRKYNCRKQRLLPVYDLITGIPGTRVATRSPIDAAIELLVAPYAGERDVLTIDLETLYEIKTTLIAAGDNFDFIYENAMGVWDAIKLALSVGRVSPIYSGSSLSAIRDDAESVISGVFSPENIIKGSFSNTISFFKSNEPDGLEIKFTDETTWKPRTITCVIGDDAGLRPNKVNLTGITDPDKAYQMGLYMRATTVLRRENFEFDTGLEGFIPAVNSLVRLSHEVPRWGTPGFVLSYVGDVITLSRPVTMETGNVYLILFKKPDGTPSDNYTVLTVAGTTDQVTISGVWEEDDLTRSDNEELASYVFGEQNLQFGDVRVTSITAKGGDRVKITATNDDPAIYTYDASIAPAVGATTTQSDPDLPVVESISVTPVVGSLLFVQVSWPPTLGATTYVLEISYDNLTWASVGTNVTTYILAIEAADEAWIRVAGVNAGQGPFVTFVGPLGIESTIPVNVTGLIVQPDFTGSTCTIRWDVAKGATSYEIKIFTDAIERDTVTVTSEFYTYTFEEAVAHGGINRVVTFEVRGINGIGESATAATVIGTNPVPSILTGVSSQLLTDAETYIDYSLSWDVSTESDIIAYRVWASDVDGFTEGPGNAVFEGLATLFDIRIDKNANGNFTTTYWKVGAIDPWGDESTASAQQKIQGTKSILIDDEGNTLIDDTTNILTN
jgi:hypothetical protein